MGSFTGEFHHTIDAKGRLIVPSRTRTEIGSDEVVLTIWLEDCIAIWSPESWDAVDRSLRALSRGDRKARALHRFIYGSAHRDEIDKQGRVTVPQSLRLKAGIDRDVVIVGAGDHAEMWSPERLNAERDQLDTAQIQQWAQDLDF